MNTETNRIKRMEQVKDVLSRLSVAITTLEQSLLDDCYLFSTWQEYDSLVLHWKKHSSGRMRLMLDFEGTLKPLVEWDISARVAASRFLKQFTQHVRDTNDAILAQADRALKTVEAAYTEK